MKLGSQLIVPQEVEGIIQISQVEAEIKQIPLRRNQPLWYNLLDLIQIKLRIIILRMR